MRHPTLLAAGAALLVLAGCQPSNKPQPLTGADSTAIAKLRADFATAWNRGNVDGVVTLYTDDAVLQQADTTALKGSNAIRTYMNSALGTPTRPTLAITSVALNGRQDLAVDAGTWTLTPPAPAAPAKGAAPAAPAPIAGKYLVVLSKQPDGGWKISWHASSPDAPMAPPAPAKHGR
ncbi:MAG TPA: SgcJ/EcaC family oxidoreductase [Gemmatimonadales bacterium]|nr:SgcJ/EcaC family oxidoreductase [Gemmatimonadales bacterium]